MTSGISVPSGRATITVFAPAEPRLKYRAAKQAIWQRTSPSDRSPRHNILHFSNSEYRRLTAIAGGRSFDLESVCLYLPYVAEWGSPLLAEEFHLAGPNSYSLGWDVLRGAARQYGRPTMAYLTNYNGAYEGGNRQRTTIKLPTPKAIPSHGKIVTRITVYRCPSRNDGCGSIIFRERISSISAKTVTSMTVTRTTCNGSRR